MPLDIPRRALPLTLRLSRVECELSIIEVAQRIGRTRQTLSAYERADPVQIPPPEILERLATIYLTTADELRLGRLPSESRARARLEHDGDGEAARADQATSQRRRLFRPGLMLPPNVYERLFALVGKIGEAGLPEPKQSAALSLLTRAATHLPMYPHESVHETEARQFRALEEAWIEVCELLDLDSRRPAT